MMKTNITVVIPAYNRKNTLTKCLATLFDQNYSCSNYEIVVVDDGSTDGTKEMVNSLIKDAPCVVRYIRQENRGPATARNVGIRNAKGDILLIIGDDIIATPTLLSEHAKWHEQYPDNNVAVLGYVTWSSEIQITPFMQWLENGGPQFNYWEIENKVEVDTQRFFFTCNISLKRKFLLDNSEYFDEEFPYAAYEDLELGHRLKKKGLDLKYNKNAIAYHCHYSSLKSVCNRMKKVGESSHLYKRKTGQEPENYSKGKMREILSKFKLIMYYSLARFYEKRVIKKNIFRYVMDYYYYVGVKNSK